MTAMTTVVRSSLSRKAPRTPPRVARGAGGAALLLLLAACAAPQMAPVPRPTAVGYEEQGKASWYGRRHHGRPTASGEPFDMHRMTAAHRTLPLGARVVVENLENGRTAEVLINDRGPYVAGRILDLSFAAAQALGAVGPGVIPVRVRVVELPDSVRVVGTDLPHSEGAPVPPGAESWR